MKAVQLLEPIAIAAWASRSINFSLQQAVVSFDSELESWCQSLRNCCVRYQKRQEIRFNNAMPVMICCALKRLDDCLFPAPRNQPIVPTGLCERARLT